MVINHLLTGMILQVAWFGPTKKWNVKTTDGQDAHHQFHHPLSPAFLQPMLIKRRLRLASNSSKPSSYKFTYESSKWYRLPSWWFEPIWKCSSNWIISPVFLGVKIQKIHLLSTQQLHRGVVHLPSLQSNAREAPLESILNPGCPQRKGPESQTSWTYTVYDM